MKLSLKIKLLIVVVIYTLIVSYGINLPYVGPNATSNNVFSLAAKNYNKFGYLKTEFVPIVSVTKDINENHNYYLNHPQLLPLFESITFRLFGDGFWTGRLTSIFPSVISLFLIYLIAKSLMDRKRALLATFIFILMPASTVFSKLIITEHLTLMFILLILYLFNSYIRTGNKKLFMIFLAISFIGIFSDWPVPLFLFFISFYLMYLKMPRESLVLFFLTVITVLFFLNYTSIYYGNLTYLLDAALNRSVGNELTSVPFWPVKWIIVLLLRIIIYFNPIFITLSGIFVIKIAAEIKKTGKISISNFSLMALFSVAFVYILLFPNGSFGHSFWVYYLLPFFALSASYYLYKIYGFKKQLFYLIILLSSFQTALMVLWKTGEIKANIWRYEIAEEVSRHINPYQKVLMNNVSAINPDLMAYRYSIPSETDNNNNFYSGSPFYYVYTCYDDCGKKSGRLGELYEKYDYIIIKTVKADLYIFDMTGKVDYPRERENIGLHLTPEPGYYLILKKMFSQIKTEIKSPQI